jgi:hypothetical protein
VSLRQIANIAKTTETLGGARDAAMGLAKMPKMALLRPKLERRLPICPGASRRKPAHLGLFPPSPFPSRHMFGESLFLYSIVPADPKTFICCVRSCRQHPSLKYGGSTEL